VIKKELHMSFVSHHVERRTRKNTFFKQINLIIDWKLIEKEINKVYKKGTSVDGRPSYPGLLLFKMMLLQNWYRLSDPEVEEMVNENLSAMAFCGLQIEDDVPDHSVISRFRKELTEKKAFDRLLKKFNQQLKTKGIIVKEGVALVDAAITNSPRKPKGKTTYEVATDRKEDEREDGEKEREENSMKLVKLTQPGVDTEARWLKKSGQLYYGYKKHITTDDEGLVLAVHTTTANEHDSKGLKAVVKKTPKKNMEKGLFGDKGYKVPANDQLLKDNKIKNRLQHKAKRNTPLTSWEKHFNKLISKSRYKVERTFGGMSRWFGAGIAKYVGLEKTHSQHVMEAIAYNLYRSPGIIMSNCQKT
jgi:IS5 family transposase